MRKIAVSFHLCDVPEHREDRAFSCSRSDRNWTGWFLGRFRDWFARRGLEVHTADVIDPRDPELDYVVYFDFGWRHYFRDHYLLRFPREKRVLIMVEPPNINPSLYYVPFYRNLFSTVFTYNRRLIENGGIPINTLMMGLDQEVKEFARRDDIQAPFKDKKLLLTISSNRWSYMPTSNFRTRNKVFEYFDRHWPLDFDLWGRYWNQPIFSYQRWLGYKKFTTYRGDLPENPGGKVTLMSRYKFCLCFENIVNEDCFIADRITDAFCARCVPVYHGSPFMADFVPGEAFIDYRRFNGPADLAKFLRAVDERTYRGYIDAAEAFLRSERAEYFTNDHLFQMVYTHLYGANRDPVQKIMPPRQ